MNDIPKKVVLRKPLVHGDRQITELVFGRELVAGDLRDIPVTNLCFDHLVTVAGRITGFPPSVLNQLSGPDFSEVGEIVIGFLDDGRETGPQG